MLLITHIVIALLSILTTGLAYLLPTTAKLHTSYALVGLTLGSGTALVIVSSSPLLKSCLTGLAYLGIVFAGIIAARYKLATAKQRHS